MHAVEHPMAELTIEGRITGPAVAGFAAALRQALDRHDHFVVVFDRTRMTAPTAQGRAALAELAATLLPRLDGRCLAWADVYDPRRYASIVNAARHDSGRAYPQRTFDDVDRARAWVRAAPAAPDDGAAASPPPGHPAAGDAAGAAPAPAGAPPRPH